MSWTTRLGSNEVQSGAFATAIPASKDEVSFINAIPGNFRGYFPLASIYWCARGTFRLSHAYRVAKAPYRTELAFGRQPNPPITAKIKTM